MLVPRPFRRRVAALLVLAATLFPVPAPRGGGERRPETCTNPSCRCGVHEPGAACCCATDGASPAGLSLAGGCGRREPDRTAPDAFRLAILPPTPGAPAPRLSGHVDRRVSSRPLRWKGNVPEPVPRSLA
jgi:hypothetical protein